MNRNSYIVSPIVILFLVAVWFCVGGGRSDTQQPDNRELRPVVASVMPRVQHEKTMSTKTTSRLDALEARVDSLEARLQAFLLCVGDLDK